MTTLDTHLKELLVFIYSSMRSLDAHLKDVAEVIVLSVHIAADSDDPRILRIYMRYFST